jgi:hypothetical protein
MPPFPLLPPEAGLVVVDEKLPPVPIGSAVVDPDWPPEPEVVVLGTAPPVPTTSAGVSMLVASPPEPRSTDIDASLKRIAESLRFELLPHPVATKAAMHEVLNTETRLQSFIATLQRLGDSRNARINTETKLQSFIATPAAHCGAYEPTKS